MSKTTGIKCDCQCSIYSRTRAILILDYISVYKNEVSAVLKPTNTEEPACRVCAQVRMVHGLYAAFGCTYMCIYVCTTCMYAVHDMHSMEDVEWEE